MNRMKWMEHPEFGTVRIAECEGRILFCGSDVARALGYVKPANAVTAHCEGVTVLVTPSRGGEQQTKFITEGDVYRLIFHSKLPVAKKFERWIFDEVLPSIRRHGAYMTDDLLEQMRDNPNLCYALVENLRMEKEKNQKLISLVDEMTPKARYYNAFVNPLDATSVRDTAKEIGVPERIFCKFLLDRKFCYRDRTGKLMPYAQHGNLFLVRDFYDQNNGYCGTYMLITPQGKYKLNYLLNKELGRLSGEEA